MTKREVACALFSRLSGLRHQPANRRFRSRLRFDPAAPIVILSPHLDDAVLNCWSVLTGGGDVAVVNLFTGAPRPGFVTAWDRLCGADDSARLMAERVAEDGEALARVGHRPLNLGFLDIQYRRCRPPPAFEVADEALATHLEAASLLYAPLGARNADHSFTRRYALAVARSGVPVRLYADVPYSSSRGWPHWVTGEARDPRHDVDVELAGLCASVPEIDDPRSAEAVRLDEEAATAKLAALRAYRTQFTALDGGPLKVLSNPAVHPFELFWTPRISR